MSKFIFVLTLIVASTLKANWHPEAHAGVDPIALQELENPSFRELKSSIVKASLSTWCTESKVRLIMDLILLKKPEVCVEIGAFSGASALPIAVTLKYNNKGILYAIDAWSNKEATKNLDPDDPNVSMWDQVNMGHAHKRFDRILSKWSLNPFCVTVQSPSESAAGYIDNIDFLHLDGDYSEEGAYRDFVLYYPKVKSGGYILISNLDISFNGKQPKLKAFYALFDVCDLITDIDGYRSVLFRKK